MLRNDKFLNCNSAIIKLSKGIKSQKVFLEIGTFVVDSKGELLFKIFLKQQLINYSSKYLYCYSINFILEVKNKQLSDNDATEIKLIITDTGEDKIFCNVYCKYNLLV